MKRLSRLLLVLPALMLLVLPKLAAAETLNLYSGRSKSLVAPIIRQFEKETGATVNVKYGDSAQLALALREEGQRSPADLFWAQDAGTVGAIAADGLLRPLPTALMERVPAAFRAPEGYWVATSGRARVLAYAPERVSTEELPRSVFDLADPKWKGRVGWAPTNASFQAFVTAMRLQHGREKTRQWLLDMMANGAKAYPSNTPIITALAAGEIDLGLPNHYYLLRFKKNDARFPVAQTFFQAGDVGNLVNVAGVGVLRSSRQPELAERFVAFLLSAKAQQYFTSDVFEYPVTDDVITNQALVEQATLLEAAPKVNVEALNDMDPTIELLREVGLL